MSLINYLRPAISNGRPREQALIRKWWHEVHKAQGHMVWEYYLGDCYVDAMWFPESTDHGSEYPGLRARDRFPISGAQVVLCEAKTRLNPELIGQALVYRVFTRRLGAQVMFVVVLAEETPRPEFKAAAEELGLSVIFVEGTCLPARS